MSEKVNDKPRGENVRKENNQIQIRDFTASDLPIMLKWLTD